jgi:hypothetical protein
MFTRLPSFILVVQRLPLIGDFRPVLARIAQEGHHFSLKRSIRHSADDTSSRAHSRLRPRRQLPGLRNGAQRFNDFGEWRLHS